MHGETMKLYTLLFIWTGDDASCVPLYITQYTKLRQYTCVHIYIYKGKFTLYKPRWLRGGVEV
jgi:hypothetical protein